MAVSCHEDTPTEAANGRRLYAGWTEEMQAKTGGYNNGKYYDCHLDMKNWMNAVSYLNGNYYYIKIINLRKKNILEFIYHKIDLL